LLGDGLAGHDAARSAWPQWYAVNGVFPVRGDIGDAGVLIDAEVIGHGAARDEFRLTRRFVGDRIDLTRMNNFRVVEVSREVGL
jgi:hypothetical protein